MHPSISSRGMITSTSQNEILSDVIYPANKFSSVKGVNHDLDLYSPDGKGNIVKSSFLPARHLFRLGYFYEAANLGELRRIYFTGNNGKAINGTFFVKVASDNAISNLGSAQSALANLGADTPPTTGITDKQFGFWTFVGASLAALALGTGVGYVVSHRHSK